MPSNLDKSDSYTQLAAAVSPVPEVQKEPGYYREEVVANQSLSATPAAPSRFIENVIRTLPQFELKLLPGKEVPEHIIIKSENILTGKEG